MELYFLRHGIAADTGPEGDASRPLTKDGAHKMKQAARGLRRLKLSLELVLSSPLVRAHETARIAADELDVELRLADELAAGCDLARLFGLLGQHRAATRVMLVGHEPDFSSMVGALTGGSSVLMKKGGLARVDTELLEAGAGTLVWLLPPSVLRGLQ